MHLVMAIALGDGDCYDYDYTLTMTSREAISESKEGYQYQTGVDKDTSKEYLGPIGPDGKRMSKYHYDKVT